MTEDEERDAINRELDRIEANLEADMNAVTAGEVRRWLQARRTVGTPPVLAAIERAVMAIGPMKRRATNNADREAP